LGLLHVLPARAQSVGFAPVRLAAPAPPAVALPLPQLVTMLEESESPSDDHSSTFRLRPPTWALNGVSAAVGTGFALQQGRALRNWALDMAVDGLCRRRVCSGTGSARASRLAADLKDMRRRTEIGLAAAVAGVGVGSALALWRPVSGELGPLHYRLWVGVASLGVACTF
jgi:hypothetical protein